MKQRQNDGDWRARSSLAAKAAAVALLAAGALWLVVTAPRLNDARAATACAERYRAAHTAADTTRVDQFWPSGGNTKVRNSAMTLRCGALRAAGKVPAS